MPLTDRLKERVLHPPAWKPRPAVLLHPNIPKPMHGLAPRRILCDEWWDQTRQAAYASTGFHCLACGVHKSEALEHQWLEGHELYDIDYLQGRMVYIETVPLCHFCHNFIHSGRLQVMVDRGEIPRQKLTLVLRRGRQVLKAAGLKPKPPYRGPIAAWADWRMVLFGKEYPPLYKTHEDWLRAFARGQEARNDV